MTNVVVYGNTQEKDLESALIGALSAYGGVEYIGPGLMSGYAIQKDPAFLLCRSAAPFNLCLKRCVVVFCRGIPPQPLELPQESVCIVESGNTEALSLLHDCGCTVLSCGMSRLDTLSVSSLKTVSAAVSIQREIFTLHGQTIDPGDIPVNLSLPLDAYSLSAAVGVLLLAGIDPQNGFAF
ncbi:MAG: hypothetical protein HFE85_03410 [Clostridiales bacterium]|nr:hypothetical protein [Clostridiales bacterium]